MSSGVCIFCFTARGNALADSLAAIIGADIIRVKNLNQQVQQHFKTGNTLIFIGAAGIAVRGIAPFIRSKTTDPAVIVIDELGHYVIPILSGHIGGANEIAFHVAKLLGATSVITTATDINDVFSVDTFAVQNGYHIANADKIKDISSHLLQDKQVGLSTEFDVVGVLPKNIKRQDNGEVGICISCDSSQKPFDKTLNLMPKCFHVGIGARKNTDPLQLDKFFVEALKDNGVPCECVSTISSIDLKQDEPAILRLADKYRIPYVTYTAKELLPFEHLFQVSEFVKRTTGVGNICETAAYCSSSRGEIIQPKLSKNGMTIAIAKQDWRVIFENTDDRH